MMITEQNTSTAPLDSLEDEGTWSHLYETLRKPVKYWVYSHRVPSWAGQEDDIIEDIIQEAILRIWKYLRKREQGQAAPVQSLSQFSKTVALNYCKDLRRRDHHLTPLKDSRWECSILVFEITEDPQEIAVERAWQDELFVCIANAINTFPAKQRTALLTDLACNIDLHSSPAALQRAFSDQGIHLEQYRQLPSEDASERNRYLSALSTARKRLKSIVLAYEADPERNQATKKPRELPARETLQYDPSKMSAQISMFWFVSSSLGVENMSSQAIAHLKTSDSEQYEAFKREITHMDKREKELANNSEDQEDSRILEDPELAGLALHLRQTRPPIVDPAYQEALQAKLLEIVLAERPRKGPDEVGDVETGSETTSKVNTPETGDTQSIDEPDLASLEDDVELAALACHLQQTVPTVPIDPRFQEALQEKLLEVVRRPPGATRKKRSWELLALKSGYPV